MPTELQTLSLSLPLGDTDSYIARVNQIAVLSAEEERRYALALQENNDLDAARILVMANLRFVVRIAKGYTGYGLPLCDLIQEGNVGLMKAVRRFDPSIGVRLVSFAVHWIKSEIHEYVIRNWRIVKIATTKAQRKLFFNLRSMKKRLGWFSQQEILDVASTLGVSTADVMSMESRLNEMDMAFDSHPAVEDDNFSMQPISPADYLADSSMDPANLIEEDNTQMTREEALSEALSSLDPRSLDIIQARWLADEKATLHDLAAKYDISAERVRQLENNALKKIKSFLPKLAA